MPCSDGFDTKGGLLPFPKENSYGFSLKRDYVPFVRFSGDQVGVWERPGKVSDSSLTN